LAGIQSLKFWRKRSGGKIHHSRSVGWLAILLWQEILVGNFGRKFWREILAGNFGGKFGGVKWLGGKKNFKLPKQLPSVSCPTFWSLPAAVFLYTSNTPLCTT
jgi:hypothetical protein